MKIKKFYIPFNKIKLTVLASETAGSDLPIYLMAHGANGTIKHPFMEEMTKLLVNKGINVIRFNFPYAEEGKKSPNSETVLLESWDEVLKNIQKKYPNTSIFIGGKSLGARMASLFAARNPNIDIKGLVFLGFPLHAPGRLGLGRADHLKKIGKPMFFIQGTRDALANFDLMKELTTKLKKTSLHSISGADHSFRVPKNREQAMEDGAAAVSNWIRKLV